MDLCLVGAAWFGGEVEFTLLGLECLCGEDEFPLRVTYIDKCGFTRNAGGKGPSERAFKDSDEVDFREALVDSPSTGQAAPMTGLTTLTTPFDCLFHTGFLAALLLPLLLEPSG
ncbi:hypothetical protein L2E82_21999 [Cichorium intybus]|uniref:Uncharacterized protein n=1 Tax=Cichorium intybus TaxID=13427 RepID=A0ACB9DWJ4_CICIN|nr:hypothetical protein L2E82_21999 [Cichorium intybus]